MPYVYTDPDQFRLLKRNNVNLDPQKMTVLNTLESLSFQNYKKHPYEAFYNVKNGIFYSKFPKKLISHKTH